MKTRYKHRKDKEDFTHEAGKVWKLACCDCGLVHRIVIIPEGKLLRMAAERDNRATAQRRRQMRKRGELPS